MRHQQRRGCLNVALLHNELNDRGRCDRIETAGGRVVENQLRLKLSAMNNYGNSLIWGHPQAPTVARLAIEGIEELAIKGGGYLLCSGCAAGDTAASIVLKVG